MHHFKTLLAAIFVLFTAVHCSDSETSLSEFSASTPTNYFKRSSQFTVEVYYEPTATPFTGSTPGGLVYWSILGDNLNTILSYRSQIPNVNYPTILSEMTQIPAQNKTSWTAQDILNLNKSFRSALPTADHARFYIYFLDGNSSEGSSVIGLSINNTPIIAIFKDVIVTSGGPAVQKFVEQSTLVHEMGHALGFVNNGVPLASSHHDSVHGAHTVNSNCIMYWLNEGASDMAAFVQQFILTDSTALWGPQVLGDAQSFSE